MDTPLDEKPMPVNDGAAAGAAADAALRAAPDADADAEACSAPAPPDEMPRALPTVQVATVLPAEKLTGADDDLEIRLRRLTRRGFARGGVAVLAALAGWRWLVTRSAEDGVPWPLRRVLEMNERLGSLAYSASRLSPEFSRSAARTPRVNGTIGLDPDLDLAAWRLKVTAPRGEHWPKWLTLDDIKALPRVEMTTELRCIEGWSTVVHWAGARLADLAAVAGLATRGEGAAGSGESRGLFHYAALETPDGGYYVGLDMPSALHPQTLLCYEMDGRPLNRAHGAPLRLVIPVKYGIKSLKQIGTIRFTDERPTDYWAERGYDWYAGH